jgi:GGDEF domain-containing protein
MRVSLVRLDAHNLESSEPGAAEERVRHVARTAGELPGGRAHRLGPSAFAVELRGVGAWEAFELAQELQSDLASTTPPIWVTAGVAEADLADDPADLLHRADVAVIAARTSRRSTVVYSSELERVPSSAVVNGA